MFSHLWNTIIKMTRFTLLAFCCLLYVAKLCFPVRAQIGKWQLLLNSTGVVPMHMALTHLNTVIMYDQTGSGPSSYPLRSRYNGTRCKRTAKDQADSTCYAHSVEYDISANRVHSLRVNSDIWCSSGAFLSNGTLLQAGGYQNGSRKIRYLEPCTNHKCNWVESIDSLSEHRWYSTSQILPENNSVIVVGGKNAFTYEFIPKFSSRKKSYSLPLLRETYDKVEGGLNLYPFVHLSSDGNLFIFANRDSILFNYKRNKVVKKFPRIPGLGARNYPNSGSSVILPLHYKDNFTKVEVLVCGGGATEAFRATKRGRHLNALRSCGRMIITGNKHIWKMENMPEPRVMNDMVILPTGHILILNGAKKGCGGYDNAVAPSLTPYLYDPEERPYRRFTFMETTQIPRMYHSSATLLPDGRVLVAGGNPHSNYTFKNVDYPTELRLEAFIPDHMDQRFDYIRPQNVSIHARSIGEEVEYGEEFGVRFWLGNKGEGDGVTFTAYAPPFVTHSNSMNQRLLVLRCTNLVRVEGGWVRALVQAPPSPIVAPPGYYLVTVVNGGIPSVSQWVRLV